MLNQIKMNVVKTAENGIVNEETIFHFEQQADCVKATYSGGQIRTGYLVGQLQEDLLTFAYCQQRITGELDHGESTCKLSFAQDSGKIQLEEHFNMQTGQSEEVGTNVFMEL